MLSSQKFAPNLIVLKEFGHNYINSSIIKLHKERNKFHSPTVGSIMGISSKISAQNTRP